MAEANGAKAPKSKAASGKPMADVTPSDKVPTDGTSKPVIVTNRPIIKDPMVNSVKNNKEVSDPPAEKSSEASQKKSATPTRTHNVIQPLSDSPKADKSEEPVIETTGTTGTAEASADAKSTEAKPETDKAAADSKPEVDDKAEENDTGDASAPDTNQKAALAKQTEAVAAELAKHEAEVEKLIDSKKYFLPINSVEKRRAKRVVVGGVIFSLLLIAAWVNIALDAGLIEIPGLKPVTHFFSS